MMSLGEIVEVFVDAARIGPITFVGLGYGIAGDVRDTEPSLGAQWLRTRGEDFYDHADNLRKAADEYKAMRRAWYARAKVRGTLKRTPRTPRGKVLDAASSRARKAVAKALDPEGYARKVREQSRMYRARRTPEQKAIDAAKAKARRVKNKVGV